LNQQRREARSESDVTSVGQSASGKEDALELTTDREPNQQMDSLLRQAMNNDRGALDELFARYRGGHFTTLPLAEQKFKTVLPLVPGVVRTKAGKLNFKACRKTRGCCWSTPCRRLTLSPGVSQFRYPWTPFRH